jgi:hypothetical protein
MRSLKGNFARSAALLLLSPLSPVAHPVVDEQAICDQVQSYVNMLVDYTRTACTPLGAGDGTFSFVVLSSEPIFSAETTKNPWLVAVVLSMGKAMNDQPDMKPGKLYFADAKARVGYFLPVDIAKSLQMAVAAGQMNIEGMYKEIQKNLGRKELPHS